MEFCAKDEEWQAQEAERLQLAFEKSTWHASTHCECSLIEYLANERNSSMKEERKASESKVEYQKADESVVSEYRRDGAMKDQQEKGGMRARMEVVEGYESSHEEGRGGGSLKESKEEGNYWSSIPPFNYIGISKPSCIPCQLWIQAFNSLRHQRFRSTTRSNQSWNWPWEIPRFESQQLGQYMVGEISGLYLEYQRKQGRLRNPYGIPTPAHREYNSGCRKILEH